MQESSAYWDDAGSAWSVTIRRRNRNLKLVIAGCVLVVLLPVPLFHSLFSRVSDGDTDLGSFTKIVSILPVVFMVLPVIMVSRMLKREGRLGEQLTKTQGRLCPVCRVAMATQETEKLECGQCKRSESVASIVTYWESYGLDGTASIGWLATYKSQGASRLKRLQAEVARRMIEDPIFPALYIIGAFFLVSLVSALFRSGSMISSVLEMVPMMILMGGFALLGVGYAKRKGVTRHCAACNYQQAPLGQPPARCPECGADWSVEGGIVHGEKIRTQKHFVTGFGMILVWVLMLFGPFAGASWKTSVLPTNSLIHNAINVWYDPDVWKELVTRTLSPSQMQTLADGMIDLVSRDEATLSSGSAWLFTTATFTPEQANRLTESLIDRQIRRDFVDPAESAWLFGSASFTQAQEHRLKIGLLDQRLREGWISIAGGVWLDAQVTVGNMPPELLARYYVESFELGLEGTGASPSRRDHLDQHDRRIEVDQDVGGPESLRLPR